MSALPDEPYYTIEDIYHLPDGQRAELIDGQIYMMAPPRPAHERLIFRMSRVLDNHIEDMKMPCEVLTSNVGVFLFDSDTTYVLPDLKVICDESRMKDDGYHGAPDFVVEVLSKATEAYDKVEKLALYKKAGVKEYWILDQAKRMVIKYVFIPEFENAIFSFDDDIPVSICDGFSINLGKLGF